jgi:hypothetical protein
MKMLRLVMILAVLTSMAFGSACDKTAQQEAEKEAETMEEANVKPSGTPDEDVDTPIEGPPGEVFDEMRREIDAYQNKIYSSSKDVPQDLRTKVDAVEAQVEQLDNSLSVDQLQGDEISEKLSATIAQVKKEWNQTKRQVDVALGTTASETDEKQK